ncbi:MAG TPA: ZIP family metal transporter [Xanthomonadaceae bacterium]|nr:ZIP family metal transporter [Xanthomonadaceae bacterium]
MNADPHALSPLALALLAGLAAAAATALGTLPVLFVSRLAQRLQDTLLGFGAGIMLAASAFSLVLPGIAEARRLGAGAFAAALLVGASLLAGGALIRLLDRVVPHEHFVKGPEGGSPLRLKRAWLFVFAICLHNLPEGLAIGVGYATDTAHGNALATGIALQDIPEGLVVALALLAVGYGRGWSLLVGMLSGLVEPLGAVAGASVVLALPALLPCGLGFAAGAMLYVVSHEIIPESHRQGHEHYATAGLMLGFVLMMVLDTALA